MTAAPEDALAEALCLLDSFAGDGLAHTYGNGQTIDATDACNALCDALDIPCEPGWYRNVAASLSYTPSPAPMVEQAGEDEQLVRRAEDGEVYITFNSLEERELIEMIQAALAEKISTAQARARGPIAQSPDVKLGATLYVALIDAQARAIVAARRFIARHRLNTRPAPAETEGRTIYVRWSDDGQHIRKWDHKPFEYGEPMVAVAAMKVDGATVFSAAEKVIAEYQESVGLASEDAWNDGNGIAEALAAAGLLASTPPAETEGVRSSADIEREWVTLAERPCETAGLEDMEPGCCAPCRARTAMAKAFTPPADAGMLREALSRVRTMLFDEHAPLLQVAEVIDAALQANGPSALNSQAHQIREGDHDDATI